MNDQVPNLRMRALNIAGIVLGIIALTLAVAVLIGCRPPETGTWTGKAISCATDSVQNNWGRVYPEVQTCLVSVATEPLQCLDAIPAALSVAIDVVACIVRSTGNEARSQAQLNPNDRLSARKAANAEEWLKTRGLAFE